MFAESIIVFFFYNFINIIEKEFLKKENDLEIVRTHISSIHAITLLTSSTLYLLNVISQDLNNLSLFFSIAFILNDSYFLINSNLKIKFQMLYHHLIFFIGVFLAYYYYLNDPLIYTTLCINGLTEISTIPLNILWIMNKKGIQNTYYFNFLSIILLITYLLFRIIFGCIILINLLYETRGIFFLQLLITNLNIFWFTKLIDKYIKNTKKNI